VQTGEEGQGSEEEGREEGEVAMVSPPPMVMAALALLNASAVALNLMKFSSTENPVNMFAAGLCAGVTLYCTLSAIWT
jgi:hypothetical protein